MMYSIGVSANYEENKFDPKDRVVMLTRMLERTQEQRDRFWRDFCKLAASTPGGEVLISDILERERLY